MFRQSFAVLNQMLISLMDAKTAMIEFSRRLPEVRLLQSAPGVGVITACRFVAYVQTPQRFSNKIKLWRYARLGITRRESNGKRLSHSHLDAAGVGSLKDCSREIFGAARRTIKDNSFKRFYEQSLDNTKNAVHARLSTRAENSGDAQSDVAFNEALSRLRRLTERKRASFHPRPVRVSVESVKEL